MEKLTQQDKMLLIQVIDTYKEKIQKDNKKREENEDKVKATQKERTEYLQQLDQQLYKEQLEKEMLKPEEKAPGITISLQQQIKEQKEEQKRHGDIEQIV
jgi:hypothetical protein